MIHLIGSIRGVYVYAFHSRTFFYFFYANAFVLNQPFLNSNNKLIFLTIKCMCSLVLFLMFI